VQIEALLTPIAADEPCGADLAYDADFMALEQAAQGKREQQFGDTIVPAVEPNWVDVRTRAEALCARTKDLRVAALLTRALQQQSGVIGLSEGLTLLQQLLEQYWDTVYPRLDVEDDNDPTMRLNALAALIDSDGMLRDLRAANLIPPSAHGRVTVRDILVASGKLPAGGEGDLTPGQIHGVIQNAAAQHEASIQAARQGLAAIQAMQSQLNERLGVERSLDLKPMTEILDVVVKTCDSALNVADAGDAGSSAAQAAMEGGGDAGTGISVGNIRSREDAVRVLERVCEFMERTEPSNPAPLLIRRAQRLVSKNFIEIIEDLAPESLGAIKGLAGLER